ncbi:MAG: hypothetical protein RR696_12800, partial [Clostridia bacterium]
VIFVPLLCFLLYTNRVLSGKVGRGATALNMVKDAENNMARLLNENDKDQKAADAENSRNEQNLMAMHERIDSVYTMLFGHKPSESEFSNLARKQKQE